MDITTLSGTLLYVVCFLIIFSESGFFFLFFLPGDSLLFALGLLANQGAIEIGYIIPLLIVAAISGNFLGYYLGKISRGGLREGRYIPKIKAIHLDRAKVFYEKHGHLALFFARFVPILRTLIPFFAGVAGMKKKTFSFWSIIGGVCWISSVTLFGYFFGREFNLQNVAFLGLIAIIAAVVATPLFIAVIKRFFK